VRFMDKPSKALAARVAHRPTIRLTPVAVNDEQPSTQMTVATFDLIAYWQELGHTRLHLTGRRKLEVKEMTQEIDRLVRAAAY